MMTALFRVHECLWVSNTKRLLRQLHIFMLIALLISGCRLPALPETEETRKPRIVATTTIIGDIIAQVGDEDIDRQVLMRPGVDPHTYVPTPGDVAAVHDADIVFINGAGLEEFLDDLLKNAGGNALIVDLSEGLQLLPMEHTHDENHDEDAEGETHAGASEHDHEDENHTHHHGEFDPHVWFSVPHIIEWTFVIATTLSEQDSANAERYASRAESYRQELEALDAWITDQIASIPLENRKLVTNHLSFSYFSHRYGMEQLAAVYPISPSAEPSAQDLARLQETIKHFEVPAIFTETTVNPRLAEQVARDTGVQILTLYSGSLGGSGSGAETYIEMMRYNVRTMVQALSR